MLKKIIRRLIERLYPEIASGLHIPQFAAVITVPDPPENGNECDEFRPFYAVDVRLLLPNGELDPDMPVMRDVPVAMTGAAPDRGFAALPQPGTIVEIAFAYGMQTKPFIRSVLPYKLKLPKIDETSQRWQQTAQVFQEVDAAGNWKRETPLKITEIAGTEYSMTSPLIYVGNKADNLLRLDSSHMAKLIATLETLAAHTHPHPLGPTGAPNEAGIFTATKAEMEGIKGRLDAFTK